MSPREVAGRRMHGTSDDCGGKTRADTATEPALSAPDRRHRSKRHRARDRCELSLWVGQTALAGEHLDPQSVQPFASRALLSGRTHRRRLERRVPALRRSAGSRNPQGADGQRKSRDRGTCMVNSVGSCGERRPPQGAHTGNRSMASCCVQAAPGMRTSRGKRYRTAIRG